MSILNNFVNPWESSGVFGSQALGKEVLEGNVLAEITLEEDTNSLNPYRAYCFDENGKLSVYREQTYQYNDAIPESSIFGTTYDSLNSPAKFKITIGTTRLGEIDTVAGAVNILSAHEYEGHGIKGWRHETNPNTHHKVYEYQRTHESWSYLTILEVDALMSSYVYYIQTELNDNPTLYWGKIKAVEQQYSDKTLYPQTNLQLEKSY